MLAPEARPYENSQSADAAAALTAVLRGGVLGQAGGGTLADVVAEVEKAGSLSRILVAAVADLDKDASVHLLRTGGRPTGLVVTRTPGETTSQATPASLKSIRASVGSDPSWRKRLLAGLGKKFLLKPGTWNLALRAWKDMRSLDLKSFASGATNPAVVLVLATDEAFRSGTVESALSGFLGSLPAGTEVRTMYVREQEEAHTVFARAGFEARGTDQPVPGLRLKKQPLHLVDASRSV